MRIRTIFDFMGKGGFNAVLRFVRTGLEARTQAVGGFSQYELKDRP